MAYNVTSEWEDIHVKLGNYIERPKEIDKDTIEKIAIEVLENYDPLESKKIEDLKKLGEDDNEDEKVLRAYTEKRMAEMKEFAKKPKYGFVFELRKQDWIQEVNNAPKDVFVVVHLYQTFNDQSNILGRILENLAKKFPLTKFMKIVATNCIENYRDEDIPGVIIYKDGSMFKQLIPAGEFFGGNKMNWKKVEYVLSSLGIVKTDIEDPDDEEEPSNDKRKKDDDSEEDDDGFKKDREYSWKLEKNKKHYN